MAVPAEDTRDWDFAQAYGLPVVRTVQPPEGWEERGGSNGGQQSDSSLSASADISVDGLAGSTLGAVTGVVASTAGS